MKALLEAKNRDFSNVVRLAQELIQNKSLSGQEKLIVESCIREAVKLGFDDAYCDKMGNFIGKIVVGDGQGKRVVLSGHLDTVHAEPSKWNPETGPFSAAIRDQKLYGLGASDMKGAFAAMFSSGALLKSLDPKEHAGEVYIVGTVVEELFEGVCFLEALKSIRPDYVVIGEASECRLNIAQRGRGEILISVLGQGKHASGGRSTVNPIEQVAFIIEAFHVWYRSEAVALLGKRNIVPTDIKIPVGGGGGLDGRGGNSTVPNEVELTYDVRTLPGDSEESIIKMVRDNMEPVLTHGKRLYPTFQEPVIEYAKDECVTYTGVPIKQNKFAPAWQTSEDDEIVVRAKRGLEKVEIPAQIGAYSFCTDGSAVVRYRELYPDAKCQVIGFGPSQESLAHTTNEYVEIDQLKKAFNGYVGIVSELLKK
ncbi:MAG: M20/M25/M40 family metallo-hydrolase [Elusimicrobia bacterium]|nr:M20/M25/M40 family metallo-hydrolase [Elusimicrobiota bacterium]